MDYSVDFKVGDYFDVPDELMELVVSIEYRLRWHRPEPDVGIFSPQPELIDYTVHLDDLCLRRASGWWDLVAARERFGDALDLDELKARCHTVLNDAVDESEQEDGGDY